MKNIVQDMIEIPWMSQPYRYLLINASNLIPNQMYILNSILPGKIYS